VSVLPARKGGDRQTVGRPLGEMSMARGRPTAAYVLVIKPDGWRSWKDLVGRCSRIGSACVARVERRELSGSWQLVARGILILIVEVCPRVNKEKRKGAIVSDQKKAIGGKGDVSRAILLPAFLTCLYFSHPPLLFAPLWFLLLSSYLSPYLFPFLPLPLNNHQLGPACKSATNVDPIQPHSLSHHPLDSCKLTSRLSSC